ncbi:transcriptional regulator [Rhizobium rosettiformans]|uniref:Transcriptional regulator n=1 Tax=Rhizobium rosettiformans TaxID=1368430 RepID=A0ABX7EWC4_9HYPH|nr:ParB N-terminal domain-containing protein [Rhizobium rosettiformans]QRF51677.1 transcriptional regulator [Rhizobium rosettiformans]
MATFKTVSIASIHVGERARPIDEDHAAAIAASMMDRGLINPLTVRSTPAANGGKTPLTLVAGGHRLRAAELNGWEEIDVIVVSADAVEAQLIELSENIYRNELTPLDRALFVLKFREVYEEKFGKIARGGDRKSKDTGCPLIFAPGRELSQQVQERLGFGPTTYKKVTRIGQKITPALRAAVRGTPAENDQKELLKLAKLPADDQGRVAASLREGADLKTIWGWLKPKVQLNADALQDETYNKIVALLAKADETTVRRVLDHIVDMRGASSLEAAE